MRRRTWLALAFCGLVGPNEALADLQDDLAAFAQSYAPRFGEAQFVRRDVAGCGPAYALDSEELRDPATGPLVLDHGELRANAVILMHGLSDSPFFMCGLARALFDAGANVVLPLLTGHGRVEPLPEAHAPELAEHWKTDAEAALAFAERRGERVSAGGLSTGGVLAVWLWQAAPQRVDGGIFLFSAAFAFDRQLKLAAACAGTAAERATQPLRRWCSRLLDVVTKRADADALWLGPVPYRNHFSDYGALQLGLLRRATLQGLDAAPFAPPLFIAHSVHDDIAPIAGVDALAARHAAPQLVERFTIDDVRAANCVPATSNCTMSSPPASGCGVSHASVVLATPIQAASPEGPMCEPANPPFDALAEAAIAFLRRLP